ncbi:MAG: hypothetical protein COB02_14470 [Candidatus Cloacimonadota bacterium]|nr:MAG: hypothetical protein COB02_14470 [Candidatus Cloacimonadota bacterium]
MTIFLVTGAAGFIGYHTSKKLLERGDTVVGLDIVNDYYDVNLKENRLKDLQTYKSFSFEKVDLCDYRELTRVFQEHKIDKVCNLAAQAGVRYSIENPFAYQKSNLEGFLNILECARHFKVENFVYASSSSVYGTNTNYPFSEEHNVDNPISLYAATKKANELMAHTYSHLYKIPTTGLRFFTVYGPFGRPDMALFLFTKAIIEDKTIDIFNHGKMQRDFTYVDDIVSGVIGSLDNNHDYEIFNLGNNKTVELTYFIECIEKSIGKVAKKNFMPLQPGDVPKTSANIEKAKKMIGFDPKTSIEEGIEHFIKWYKSYY